MIVAPRRSARGLRWAFSLALLSNAAAVGTLLAQEPLRPYPEIRAEAIIAQPNAGVIGAGLQIPLGFYARLGVDATGGVARSHDESFGTARGDVIMRFLLDPFREAPWALSAGAGVTVRYMDPHSWRALLAVVVDVEGRRAGGVSPAVQVGLGGGVRLGVALRFSSRAYR